MAASTRGLVIRTAAWDEWCGFVSPQQTPNMGTFSPSPSPSPPPPCRIANRRQRSRLGCTAVERVAGSRPRSASRGDEPAPRDGRVAGACRGLSETNGVSGPALSSSLTAISPGGRLVSGKEVHVVEWQLMPCVLRAYISNYTYLLRYLSAYTRVLTVLTNKHWRFRLDVRYHLFPHPIIWGWAALISDISV